MEEISKDSQTVSDFIEENASVAKPKRTRKTTKAKVSIEEMPKNGPETEKTSAVVEEKAQPLSEAKTVLTAPKENNEKSLQRRNNHPQLKNNFKASPQNKFQASNNVPACPANLQRYRWWMGQLYQWRNISDINSLNNLVNEVSDEALEPFLLNEWYEKPLSDLLKDIPEESQLISLTRQSILREKMRKLSEAKHPIYVEGVIVKVPNTEEWSVCYAFDNYQLRELSAYLPKSLVRKYGLRPGQTVKGQLFVSPTYVQCPCIIKISSVMGKLPEEMRTLAHFKELVPYYPTQRILLETKPEKRWDNNSMRIVDILTPIGFGQRGLIVAPPRTGKTVLLQNIANSIVQNQPQAHLIVLLIDERPEEVTDFKNLLPGIEVISSTFDESPESHVRAAEAVIEKAKRLVEVGENVIILLDSITRLARAYNTIIPSSGKVLSGGVEANALQGPKAFFGAARNIEKGGSLTILATALVDTGSKMDEVIFEEFKGTGNMEIHLDRSLIDRRIFPAINIEKSGTRKEELLYHPDELLKIYSLRRAMKGVVPSIEAMEMLLDRIKKTNNNIEFLMSINS
jgi:transcription termination factor Rho